MEKQGQKKDSEGKWEKPMVKWKHKSGDGLVKSHVVWLKSLAEFRPLFTQAGVFAFLLPFLPLGSRGNVGHMKLPTTKTGDVTSCQANRPINPPTAADWTAGQPVDRAGTSRTNQPIQNPMVEHPARQPASCQSGIRPSFQSINRPSNRTCFYSFEDASALHANMKPTPSN